jgi:hypothetical protein
MFKLSGRGGTSDEVFAMFGSVAVVENRSLRV